MSACLLSGENLAARIHSIYVTGQEDFDQSVGGVWYQTYVDYALENGIVSQADLDGDLNQAAARWQFAKILAASLPSEALGAINEVSLQNIPDVDAPADYASVILALYQAGILTGDAGSHAFRPDDTITRAEAAAIITRMADSDSRMTVDMG